MATALDALDPTLERSFRGHKGPVSAVSFSPTLRQLASGASDGCVMVWNFRPQLRAFRYVGHKVRISIRRSACSSTKLTKLMWTCVSLSLSLTLFCFTYRVKSQAWLSLPMRSCSPPLPRTIRSESGSPLCKCCSMCRALCMRIACCVTSRLVCSATETALSCAVTLQL